MKTLIALSLLTVASLASARDVELRAPLVTPWGTTIQTRPIVEGFTKDEGSVIGYSMGFECNMANRTEQPCESVDWCNQLVWDLTGRLISTTSLGAYAECPAYVQALAASGELFWQGQGYGTRNEWREGDGEVIYMALLHIP